jgi:hypothetical protein
MGPFSGKGGGDIDNGPWPLATLDNNFGIGMVGPSHGFQSLPIPSGQRGVKRVIFQGTKQENWYPQTERQ